MGSGKSRIALVLNRLYNISTITLIICRKKAFHTWKEELRKVGWKGYVAEFPVTKWYSKKKNTIWLVSESMLRKLHTEFRYYPISNIIIDELYLYSNPKSARTKAMHSVNTSIDVPTVGLSGTIMPAKDNTAIYAQASVIGIQGELARTLTDFRSKYQTFFDANYGRGSVRRFVNAPNSDKKIRERLAPFVDFYFPTNSDRIIRDSFIRVDPTQEQLKYIKQLKEEYYVETRDQIFELRSAIELIHRVSGISNGYLGSTNINSPKLDTLEGKVRECLNECERVLVWCYYQRDIEILSKCFKDFRLATMSGKQTLDPEDFRKAQIIIATVGTGSSINDFAQIPYAFYFSNSSKLLDYEQSRARNDRADSRHSTAFYTYFFTNKTFDKHIYQLAKTSDKIQADFINLI
jgi:hypothetical protein